MTKVKVRANRQTIMLRNRVVTVTSHREVSGNFTVAPFRNGDWFLWADAGGLRRFAEMAALARRDPNGLYLVSGRDRMPTRTSHLKPELSCDLLICQPAVQLRPSHWTEAKRSVSVGRPISLSIAPPCPEGSTHVEQLNLNGHGRTVVMTATRTALEIISRRILSLIGETHGTIDASPVHQSGPFHRTRPPELLLFTWTHWE